MTENKREDLMQKLAGYRISAGPLSVAFACVFAMCIVSVIEYVQPNHYIPLDAAGCVSTVILIIDMGTTERLYVMTALRVCGTIIGVSVGVLLALIEKWIQTSYRHKTLLDLRTLGVDSLDWVLIVFRISTIGPIVYLMAFFMRKYPKYSSAFLVAAIQCPSGLLSPNFRGALGVATGAALGSIAAIVSVLFLAKFNSKSLLRDNAKLVLDEVLEITQMAVKADAVHVNEFQTHVESIHKIISHNESAFDIYAVWRTWTFRTCDINLRLLIGAARPLFYQAYSLYWGNVSSCHAADYNAQILFCDNQAMYEAHFKYSATELADSLANIKIVLTELQCTDCAAKISHIIDLVLNDFLENGLFKSQEQMKRAFQFNKYTCFSTISQQWNMTDYLRQIAMISLALIEYIKAVVCVFEKGVDQVAHVARLEKLVLQIDNMRRHEDPESPKRTIPNFSLNNPLRLPQSPRQIQLTSPRIFVDPISNNNSPLERESLLRNAR